MSPVKTPVYQALTRLERFINPDETDVSRGPYITEEEARAALATVEAEVERLAKAYDAFGRFTTEDRTPGYFNTQETAVRDLARYRVKYERVRAAVRVLNKVLRERRVMATEKRYRKLLDIAEALTWKVGEHEGMAAGFTWIRFDTREEYAEYNAWRRERKAKP